MEQHESLPSETRQSCDCGHVPQCPTENYWRLRTLIGRQDAPYAIRYQLCELLRAEAQRLDRVREADLNENHHLNPGWEPPEALRKRAGEILASSGLTEMRDESSAIQARENLRDAIRHGVREISAAILADRYHWREKEIPQVIEDPEAVPAELRTEPDRWEAEEGAWNEGSYQDIQPITVLRLPGCGILTEIVRITDVSYAGRLGYACRFYKIHLIDPSAGRAVEQKPRNSVTVDYGTSTPDNAEFFQILELLRQSAAYIERLQTKPSDE